MRVVDTEGSEVVGASASASAQGELENEAAEAFTDAVSDASDELAKSMGTDLANISVYVDAFKDGKVTDAEAGAIAGDALTKVGVGIATFFGIPPQASERIIGPIANFIGKPIGKAAKKLVEGIGKMFGGGRQEPISARIDEHPGTWFGRQSVEGLQNKILIKGVIEPSIAQLQMMHQELGLQSRYWPEDVLNSLWVNFGVPIVKCPHDTSKSMRVTTGPGGEAPLSLQRQWLRLIGSKGSKTYTPPPEYHYSNLCPPPFWKYAPANKEAFKRYRATFVRNLKDWAEKFQKAAAKEQLRLGAIKAAVEAKQKAPQQKSINYPKWLNDFASQTFLAKNRGPIVKRDYDSYIELYKRGAGNKTGLVGVASGLQYIWDHYPAWWSEWSANTWLKYPDRYKGPNYDRYKMAYRAASRRHSKPDSLAAVAVGLLAAWRERISQQRKRLGDPESIVKMLEAPPEWLLTFLQHTALADKDYGRREIRKISDHFASGVKGEGLAGIASGATYLWNQYPPWFPEWSKKSYLSNPNKYGAWKNFAAAFRKAAGKDKTLIGVKRGLIAAWRLWIKLYWDRYVEDAATVKAPAVAEPASTGFFVDLGSGELKSGKFRPGNKRGFMIRLDTGELKSGSFKPV